MCRTIGQGGLEIAAHAGGDDPRASGWSGSSAARSRGSTANATAAGRAPRGATAINPRSSQAGFAATARRQRREGPARAAPPRAGSPSRLTCSRQPRRAAGVPGAATERGHERDAGRRSARGRRTGHRRAPCSTATARRSASAGRARRTRRASAPPPGRGSPPRPVTPRPASSATSDARVGLGDDDQRDLGRVAARGGTPARDPVADPASTVPRSRRAGVGAAIRGRRARCCSPHHPDHPGEAAGHRGSPVGVRTGRPRSVQPPTIRTSATTGAVSTARQPARRSSDGVPAVVGRAARDGRARVVLQSAGAPRSSTGRQPGPSGARIPPRRAPAAASRRRLASARRPAGRRRPACAAATTPASASASSTGTQSATRTPIAAPGALRDDCVVAAVASHRGRWRAGRRPPRLLDDRSAVVPCTWRPKRPAHRPSRRADAGCAATRCGSSPTCSARLRSAQSPADTPPARPVNPASTPGRGRRRGPRGTTRSGHGHELRRNSRRLLEEVRHVEVVVHRHRSRHRPGRAQVDARGGRPAVAADWRRLGRLDPRHAAAAGAGDGA